MPWLWAGAEASRRNAPLLVLYAANYSGMTIEPGPGLHHRDPGALEAAEEVTAGGVAEVLEAHPGLVVAGATEVTSPARALIEASAGAAMVVLGNRGHGRLLGALLGSVAFNVAARAPCPVIVVKDESAHRRPGPDNPVVVGTDGSPEAGVAVSFAADHASAASAPLEVVTGTGGHQVKDVDERQLRASAHRIAEAAADRARAAYAGAVDHHPCRGQHRGGHARRPLRRCGPGRGRYPRSRRVRGDAPRLGQSCSHPRRRMRSRRHLGTRVTATATRGQSRATALA